MSCRRRIERADLPAPGRLATSRPFAVRLRAAACRPARRLQRGGAASRYRPATRETLQRRFGYYLSFLHQAGRLDGAARAADLVTPANVEAFVAHVAPFWSSVTVALCIDKLRIVATMLAPNADFAWLKARHSGPGLRGLPEKAPTDPGCGEIVAAGLALFQEGESGEDQPPRRRANFMRDGLMLALLATHPIRVRTSPRSPSDRACIAWVTSWWIDLRRRRHQDRAGRCAAGTALPAAALEPLSHWARPILSAERALPLAHPAEPPGEPWFGERPPAANLHALRGRLWLSCFGKPMSETTVHRVITHATRQTLGVAMNPHAFRSAPPQRRPGTAPANPHLAAALLQHTDRRVTETHYIRASSFQGSARPWPACCAAEGVDPLRSGRRFAAAYGQEVPLHLPSFGRLRVATRASRARPASRWLRRRAGPILGRR